MSKRKKLLKRFLSVPVKKDLTYPELETLLESLGYVKEEGAGSRVSFYHPGIDQIIDLHKPHPANELKAYQVWIIQKTLRDE